MVTDGVGDESESDPNDRMADCVDRSKYTNSGGPRCRLCVNYFACVSTFPRHVPEEKGNRKYNVLKTYSRVDMSDNTIHLFTFTERAKTSIFEKDDVKDLVGENNTELLLELVPRTSGIS